MLILDLNTGLFSKSDDDAEQNNNYPDEVLDSGWNPVLTEIQSIQPSSQKPSKPALQVIEASLAHLYEE